MEVSGICCFSLPPGSTFEKRSRLAAPTWSCRAAFSQAGEGRVRCLGPFSAGPGGLCQALSPSPHTLLGRRSHPPKPQ